MKKIPVYQETWQDENGNERAYEYYLLVEEVRAGNFFCEEYGVSVKEKSGEESEIRGITCQKQRVEDLLSLLCEYSVSPVTLGDVLADWL